MKSFIKIFSALLAAIILIGAVPQSFAASEKLTVNLSSNFFKESQAVFDADTEKITVSCMFKSNYKVLDCEWVITYDNTKLSLDKSSLPSVMPNLAGSTSMVLSNNKFAGNYSSLSLSDFSEEKDFIKVSFNVIGTGSAELNIKLLTLGLGYKNGNEVVPGYLVDFGELQNLSEAQGFETLSHSQTSAAYTDYNNLPGDVNQDGAVTIDDATMLQRALVKFISLTPPAKQAAEMTGDGKLTIRDVTNIQRAVAGF